VWSGKVSQENETNKPIIISSKTENKLPQSVSVVLRLSYLCDNHGAHNVEWTGILSGLPFKQSL